MNKKRIRQLREQFEREKLWNKMAQPGPNGFILVLDHLKPDFNIGKIFRTADAMGATEVFLIGVDFFDPGPAKGSFRHVPARFFSSFEEAHPVLREQDYDIYVLEPEQGRFVDEVSLSKKSAFVLGHEEFGISFDPAKYEGVHRLKIRQFGKVQSLNVSVAAAVIMHEHIRQRYAVPFA